MEKGRRAAVALTFNGKGASKDIAPYLEEFTFTDVATGGSDEVSMTLNNTDMRFLKAWKPLKGMKISAGIITKNWNRADDKKIMRCGKFVTDDLTGAYPPSTFTIKAVSAPVRSEFKDRERTKTYKGATIKSIAAKIAKRAGVKLHYEAGKIKIKEVEQSKEADSSFLSSLCEEYGLGLKIYNNKIVIYDEEKYENKPPVATIERKGGKVTDWEWNTTLQRTYTCAKVTYTDSDSNKKNKAKVGKKGRTLTASVTAYSKKDAKLKAEALLRSANKTRTTMIISTDAIPGLYATAVIKLSGFGKASGNYFVDTVTHTLSGESGYEMQLELHKLPV